MAASAAGNDGALALAGREIRPRRTSSTSARVSADGGIPSSERKALARGARGGERRGTIAGEREQADQLAMGRLGLNQNIRPAG